MNVLPEQRYSGFWDKYEKGAWEPETFLVLDRFLKPTSTYIDVGGWIGPTVLYAAQRAAKVIAFEPDNVARAGLEGNLAANEPLLRKVEIHAVALAPETGTATLRSSAFGNSESTIATSTVKKRDGLIELKNVQECQTLSVRDAYRRFCIANADLVKIDIEGGEYALIKDLAAVFKGGKTPLFISFHPNAITDTSGEEVAQSLRISESLRVAEAFKDFLVLEPVSGDLREINLEQKIAAEKKPLWDGFVFVPRRAARG